MAGPVQDRAEAEIAAAEERIASSKRSHDEYMHRIHFTGSSAGGYKLTASALTEEEAVAVKVVCSGKAIPERALDPKHGHLLVGGGSVETVTYVAAKCRDFGIDP